VSAVDVNEALRRIRAQVRELRGLVDNEDLDAEALAMSAGTLVDATDGLDGWLSRGGCLPTAWAAGR
jgi:hypothetical protein